VKHIAQTYKQRENKGKQTKQNKEELHKTKKTFTKQELQTTN